MPRWSRPLLVWERVGLAVSCLAVWWVCVCVRACKRTECIDGDVQVGMPQSWALS